MKEIKKKAAVLLSASLLFGAGSPPVLLHAEDRTKIESVTLHITAELGTDSDFSDMSLQITAGSGNYSLDDYEITNEQIDGDTATVDVKITTYTVGDAFNTFITDYMSQGFTLALSGASEDDLSELASSIFSTKINSMEKSYTDTVTVSLSKVDGNWKVDDIKSNAELTDALLGGLYTTIESLDGLYE